MSQYALFTKRVGLVSSSQIIIGLRGLIILPILTKTLGASSYGIWALVMVTIALLQPIIQLGLGNALLRFFSSRGRKEIGQGVITALSVV
ncbi:MAG: oligosaccharide flippase family protein, partial [Dehalococcoidales bacterium]|nr:oligosaccharide flippase family protein [Dehalococcoidales bacterium]